MRVGARQVGHGEPWVTIRLGVPEAAHVRRKVLRCVSWRRGGRRGGVRGGPGAHLGRVWGPGEEVSAAGRTLGGLRRADEEARGVAGTRRAADGPLGVRGGACGSRTAADSRDQQRAAGGGAAAQGPAGERGGGARLSRQSHTPPCASSCRCLRGERGAQASAGARPDARTGRGTAP